MKCTDGKRHWFTYYGFPGSSSPTCVRFGCRQKNPGYDWQRDPNAGEGKSCIHCGASSKDVVGMTYESGEWRCINEYTCSEREEARQ